MEKKVPYRLWLKLRVGTALATQEVALTASLAGREVTIKSERSEGDPIVSPGAMGVGVASSGKRMRRAVRVLNLAEMNKDPIARVVLAISTVEGLAADHGWTERQKELITDAADWLERAHGGEEATGQVIEAIRRSCGCGRR